jgi:glycosyltransferase involved in cell wall biosynthesis
VLFVIGSLQTGGTQKHVVELLRRLDRTQFDPRVVVFKAGGFFYEQVQELGVPIDVLQVRSRRTLVTQFFAFLKLLRVHRPHVMHVFLFHSSMYGCLSRLFLLGRGPKVILSKRSMNLELGAFEYVAYRYLLMRAPHLVTAVSEPVLDRCLELGAQTGKLRLIRNGIECPYVGTRGRLRAAVTGVGDAPLVGCVGSLTPRKQHLLIIRAFPRVLERHASARLVILGEGGMRPQLEAEVRRLNLVGRVLLPGSLTPAIDYMADLDVFVLPSSEEGTSNALLEAMSVGVPCVASDIPSNRLVIADGREGLLVNVEDPDALSRSICSLLGNRRLASAFSVAARERLRAERDPMEMMAENARAYREMAGVVELQ